MLRFKEISSMSTEKNNEKENVTILRKRDHRILQRAVRLTKRKVRVQQALNAHKEFTSFQDVGSVLGLGARRVADDKRIARAAVMPPQDPSTIDSHFFLVVRNSSVRASETVHRYLKAIGLDKPNTATFIRRTPTTIRWLTTVGSVIYYGTPSLNALRVILQRAATLRKDKSQNVCSSNTDIEEALGKYNIICLEDAVQCIYHGKEGAQEVINFFGVFPIPDVRLIDGDYTPKSRNPIGRIPDKVLTEWISQLIASCI